MAFFINITHKKASHEARLFMCKYLVFSKFYFSSFALRRAFI